MRNKQSGFTLIETMVYIALFVIIMGGLLVAVYAMLDSNDAIAENVLVNEEANFITSKISRAISDSYAVTNLSPSTPTSTSLVLLTLDPPAPYVVITVAPSGTDITIQRGLTATSTLLNDTGAKITDLLFEYFETQIPPNEYADVEAKILPGVKTSFKINNTPVSIFRYLRTP